MIATHLRALCVYYLSTHRRERPIICSAYWIHSGLITSISQHTKIHQPNRIDVSFDWTMNTSQIVTRVTLWVQVNQLIKESINIWMANILIDVSNRNWHDVILRLRMHGARSEILSLNNFLNANTHRHTQTPVNRATIKQHAICRLLISRSRAPSKCIAKDDLKVIFKRDNNIPQPIDRCYKLPLCAMQIEIIVAIFIELNRFYCMLQCVVLRAKRILSIYIYISDRYGI